MKKVILFVAGMVICFFSPLSGYAQEKKHSTNNISYEGIQIPFYQFTPEGYSPSSNQKYPLIIFLHGIGERGPANGSELIEVTINGIPKLIAEGNKMEFLNLKTNMLEKFIVLSPQLFTDAGEWSSVYVNAMIDYATTELKVDINRIHLTGLSLGAAGGVIYASESKANAEKLATLSHAAIVSPNVGFNKVCTTIVAANLPVWSFINSNDYCCGGTSAFEVYKGKLNCNINPNPLARHKMYDGGGHDSWTKAYSPDNTIQSPENIYQWMLSNIRTSTQPNQPPVIKFTTSVGPANPGITSGSNIYLDGYGSNDPDTPLVFNWTKISGADVFITNPDWAGTNVNNLKPGDYVFRFTVTDSKGAVSMMDYKLTVSGNQPPKIVFASSAGPDNPGYTTSNNVYLDGYGSNDPDTPLVFNWTKIRGEEVFITNPDWAGTNINNLISGQYVFRFTVTDRKGAVSTLDYTLNVTRPLQSSSSRNRIDELSVNEINKVRIFIYPNPVIGALNLTISSNVKGNTNIRVYDIDGKLVLSSTSIKTQQLLQMQLNTSNLLSGMYNVEITIANKQKVMTKFIKK